MIPHVHILCTCRNPEILRGTTLVFDSLRVGYPTAKVTAYLNAIQDEHCKQEVLKACSAARVDNIAELETETIHHKWIEGIVASSDEPVVFLDTDIVFWSNCEGWEFKKPLAGRYVPQFKDGFTKCITRPRLHGSHLWVKPVELRKAIEDYRSQFPVTPFNPGANLFYPIYLPVSDGNRVFNVFHDTCCLLYQAIGGEAFAEEHLNCFDHLHSGTISDIVAPHLKDIRIREAHFAIFENPKLARGCWRDQEKFYLRHAA